MTICIQVLEYSPDSTLPGAMGDLSDIAGDQDVEVLVKCVEAYNREGGSSGNPFYVSEIQRQALF